MQVLVNLEELSEEEEDTRCERLLITAMRSHHPCYVDHEFCTIIIHSWKNFREILYAVVDWTDFLPGSGLVSVLAWDQVSVLAWDQVNL